MFWKFITKNVYLNQNLIKLDKRLLENYYKFSFYNVEILDTYAEIKNNSSDKLINQRRSKYF